MDRPSATFGPARTSKFGFTGAHNRALLPRRMKELMGERVMRRSESGSDRSGDPGRGYRCSEPGLSSFEGCAHSPTPPPLCAMGEASEKAVEEELDSDDQPSISANDADADQGEAVEAVSQPAAIASGKLEPPVSAPAPPEPERLSNDGEMSLNTQTSSNGKNAAVIDEIPDVQAAREAAQQSELARLNHGQCRVYVVLSLPFPFQSRGRELLVEPYGRLAILIDLLLVDLGYEPHVLAVPMGSCAQRKPLASGGWRKHGKRNYKLKTGTQRCSPSHNS